MRKLVIVLSCCTAFLLVGYASYRGYKVWKQSRMIGLARNFLTKKDSRDALLSLQQALRSNPENVEACRLMAQLAESMRSPEAVLWRSRVVEIDPRSSEDRLALAQTALLFRDYATATNALEGLDTAARQTANYHNVAGSVAIAENRFPQAEAHFSEAARLEPTNAAPRFNLAMVRLRGTNSLDLAEARISLQRIIADPQIGSLRCQAMRELVADAVRNKQTETAIKLCDQLVRDTNSVFSDNLLRLEVLRDAKDPNFKATLATIQTQATNELATAYELGVWQMAKLSPTDALVWVRSLSMNLQTNQMMFMLAADCQNLQEDWQGLQASLIKQNWAGLDFLRHALLARALRGQELAAAAKTEWELAVKATNNRKQSLTVLLRSATQWGWNAEMEEILWTIVNQYPGETWAFRALNEALYANGRTRPLMMLYSQELKHSPTDLDMKNNLATTALLLDAQEVNPHALAREVYEKASTNAVYASTYAFSLHLQKKNTEALQVLQKLSPKQLENPSIAGYYGLVLKAAGDPSKAKAYLAWASKAKLLPEEQKLFDRAKAGT
jgi:predicted Zn-dependent protease